MRDDEAKKALKIETKSSVQIFTILESKGLEFEDVILYNFFGNSAWSGLNMKDLTALSKSSPAPGTYEASKYAVSGIFYDLFIQNLSSY